LRRRKSSFAEARIWQLLLVTATACPFDGPLHAARAIGEDARSVLASADLAFELNVRALGESARVGREFAKDNTAVPFGDGLAPAGATVFPAAMRR
jgi:hypothetical protein